MTEIKNGIAKAVPTAVREWGVYSLIVVFMAGAGWIVSQALDRQHELIQAVCNTGLDRVTTQVESATKLTQQVSNAQKNLVPIVMQLLHLSKEEFKREMAKPDASRQRATPSFP